MKSMLTILEESEQEYSDPSNRGVDGCFGSYTYSTEDGKRCAVGRCMMRPGFYEHSVEELSSRVTGKVVNVDATLKPEYRGHPLKFWCALQNWHDNDRNFTGKGFSAQGLAGMKRLKLKFGGVS